MKLYSDYTPLHKVYYDDGIFCSVCGRELHYHQGCYTNGEESVCNDENCMEEFYENNADQMLIDFANEMDLKQEAKTWFFENL